MLVTSKQIRNTSVLYKYFLSEQYRKNTWTLTQCVKYALKFEQLYYSETFIRDFNALLAGLNEISQRRLKFIFARMIFFSFLNRDSLYDEEEMAKYRVETRIINNISKREKYYTLDDYSFINGNMTIHNFIDDMGLKDLESIDEIRDRSIIDVGAYVGDSSLILSKYTNKKVYAFEPFPEAFRELVENVSLNKSYKIEPVKLGISDICGLRKLYFAKVKNLSISTNDPERSLSKGEYDSIEIQTITIDKFVQENNITVGLIKIDAEGAERDVLEGARKTILRDKPIMLVSIYHNIDDFMHIKPWIENLELSYKYKIIKLEPTTFVEETMLVCY
jgi:FkbM family methyltransferase